MDAQHDALVESKDNLFSAEVPVYASLDEMLMAADSLYDFIDMTDAALEALYFR